MKLKTIIYTLLILGIIAFITYRIVENKSGDAGPKGKDQKNKSMTVNGIVVKAQTFDNTLSLSGSIEANEQVDIRSEVSGIVEGLCFNHNSINVRYFIFSFFSFGITVLAFV